MADPAPAGLHPSGMGKGARLIDSEVRRIRLKAGLSLGGLAKVLRIADISTIHRWEKGARSVSGPASILLEMIDTGELPARYMDQ